MANFTLTNNEKFPVGAVVSAHDATNHPTWPGSPPGAAVATQTMAAAGLTFAGLKAGGRYFAHATVSDEDVVLAFTADAAVEPALLSLDLGSPALGTTTAVLAAVTDDGDPQTITAGITDPPTPRVLTATAGGTAGDIGAIAVTVHGTNADDEAISEVLPAFTVDTAGTVTGAKAFKTVTSVVIPAHDGTGATTAVGLGDVLGLGVKLSRDSVLNAFFDGALETTRPTVAFDADAVESNTVDLDSTLDASAVIVDLYQT